MTVWWISRWHRTELWGDCRNEELSRSMKANFLQEGESRLAFTLKELSRQKCLLFFAGNVSPDLHKRKTDEQCLVMFARNVLATMQKLQSRGSERPMAWLVASWWKQLPTPAPAAGLRHKLWGCSHIFEDFLPHINCWYWCKIDRKNLDVHSYGGECDHLVEISPISFMVNLLRNARNWWNLNVPHLTTSKKSVWKETSLKSSEDATITWI